MRAEKIEPRQNNRTTFRPNGEQNRSELGFKARKHNPAVYSQRKRQEFIKNYEDPTKPIRLNKYLANAGICSRREADDFISAGVISVNGVIVDNLGAKVLPTDKVMFHDQPVRRERKVYILLNKPKNTVTTTDDPQERHTVLDIVRNACAERITRLGEASMYVIRSGRMFIKDPANDYTGMKRYYMTVYDVLYDELRCRLMENACYVKYNKGINIAVPTSEKNFVGDIPFGSYINIADHAMIGIYWRNAWGTRDFDLSMTDIKGNKIGWNSAYYSDKQDVIYSGDMTCADPEATEILYYKNNAPQGFININRYSGNDGSKYKLFVANEEVQTLRKNYIVDPTHITFEAMCVSDTPQQVIGLVNGNSFTIMNVGNGYGQVSRRNGNEQKSFDALSHKACSYLQLKQLLHDAGYVDIDTVEETEDWKIPEDAKIIDLTTLSRDTLINIMEGNA